MATATLRPSGENRGEGRVESEGVVEDDVVFDLLSNRRRRLVVQVLTDAERAMEIGPLATRVAAHEHGIELSAVTACQRKSVYTSLHQNHLPKLAEAGFVTADREWVDVRLTRRATALQPYLEPEPTEDECQWWSVALAAAVGAAAAVPTLPNATLTSTIAAIAVAATVAVACWRITSSSSEDDRSWSTA